MARMFGTDGVRGVAGSELTIELANKVRSGRSLRAHKRAGASGNHYCRM